MQNFATNVSYRSWTQFWNIHHNPHFDTLGNQQVLIVKLHVELPGFWTMEILNGRNLVSNILHVDWTLQHLLILFSKCLNTEKIMVQKFRIIGTISLHKLRKKNYLHMDKI